MYKLIYSEKALKQLKKLDAKISDRILKTLERIKIRPHHFVKSLSDSPYSRLRVGNYRLILDIQNNKLIILILELGHRKNIYKT